MGWGLSRVSSPGPKRETQPRIFHLCPYPRLVGIFDGHPSNTLLYSSFITDSINPRIYPTAKIFPNIVYPVGSPSSPAPCKKGA